MVKKRMDPETRRSIKANLFKAAHPAIEEPWDNFLWHTCQDGSYGALQRRSSQALTIDVFGTIKCSPYRDKILDSVASTLGLPTGGPWDLQLEWVLLPEVLGEPRPTQVDVYAKSDQALMLFECKFMESDGGACSQTQPISKGPHRGMTQCNGRYEMQVNPANGVSSRCALSGKNIVYWEVVPKVFNLSAEMDHSPCPFAGPWYQWMRNLAACWQVSQRVGKPPVASAFVIVYANAPGLPMAEKIASPEWKAFTQMLRSDVVHLHTLSFQQLISIAQDTVGRLKDAEETWKELSDWVQSKIQDR